MKQKQLTQKVNDFIDDRKKYYLKCLPVVDRFNPYKRLRCEMLAIKDKVQSLEERAKFVGVK